MTLDMTLCYSGAATQGSKHRLGSPHYSYRFAEEKFSRCLAEMNLAMHFLPMPEYYSAGRAYAELPRYNGKLVQLIFRSTESIRVLKDGYNIVCFAWEFPYLKESCIEGEHPFSNQVRMLKLCNEIWVPCLYTKRVLEQHGLANVYCIPAPIANPKQPRASKDVALRRLGHVDTKTFHVNFIGNYGIRRGDDYLPFFTSVLGATNLSQRKIYLAIFNPEDFRKNLDALIRGFDAFAQKQPGALLIIKALTAVERFSLEQVVWEVMTRKLRSGSSFANDNIIVFNQYLSEDEMTALYDMSDFYLCTSVAEGQNLPLQEAMVRGVVPVTTRNTAMLDYIDDSNSIVIEAERVLNDNEHMAGNVAGKPYHLELCSAAQVATALNKSAELSEDAYSDKSAAAKKAMDAYSCARVRIQIEDRLRIISPS